MELATQIKQHRNRMGWSQEELAERAFVSRQTISNWENDKSYPDIQSLLLLSTLFDVSLDQLVKGDVEIMKQQTQSKDLKKFKRMGGIYSLLFLLFGVSALGFALTRSFTVGAVCAIVFIVMMGYAVYIERWKKKMDIQTYKEILAFLNGVPVDEIRSERQLKKEFIIKLLAGAAVGFVAALIGVWIINR